LELPILGSNPFPPSVRHWQQHPSAQQHPTMSIIHTFATPSERRKKSKRYNC